MIILQLARSPKLKCNDCITSIVDVTNVDVNQATNSLITVKNQGGLTLSSPVVIEVCNHSEKATRVLLSSAGLMKNFARLALIATTKKPVTKGQYQVICTICISKLKVDLQQNSHCSYLVS